MALEHAEFTKGLDKSSQEALRFAKNTQDSFDKVSNSTKAYFASMAQGAVTAGAAFLSLNSALSFAKSSLDFADQMLDVANANEITVGTVLRLSEALTLSGGKAADSSKVFSALTQSIDTAASGSKETQARFATLGITLQDLAKLDGQEIFNKTLSGLRAIEDPIKRNAAAADLLGKAVKGVDVKGLADSYANNMTDFTDAEAAFDKIGQAFDRIDRFSLKASTSLAENFAPALEGITKFLDSTFYGFDNLEKNIRKFSNGDSKWSPSAKIGQEFIASGLPEGYQSGARRTVIDTVSEEQKKSRDNEAKRRQEEAERRAKTAADQAARDAKARYDAELEEIKRMVQEELEATDAINSYKMDKLKELADAQKKLDDEELKRKERVMDILQDQATRNFDEAQRQQKEQADTAKRQAEDLSRSLTDALLRTFESGEGGAKAFMKNLANIFKARVFQVGIELVLSKTGLSGLLGTVSALLSGNATAGDSVNGGGVSSLFSSVKDFFGNGNGSIISSIENLGSIIANGNGGLLDTIGGFIGANSSAIADGFGYFGAAMQLAQGNIGGGLGAGIGTLVGGPIGGAIGSFLGGALGGMFGGSTPKRNWAQVTGTYKDDAFNVSSVFSKRGGSQALEPLTNLSETFSTQLGSLFKAFDLNSVINTIAAFSTRPGKKTNADFGGSVDGVGFGTYGIRYGKKDQEAWSKFVNTTLGEVTVQAIEASSLPEGVKKFFDGLTKKEDVSSTINTLASLNLALADLPPVFNAIRNAIETTDYTTAVASLQAQFQAVQTYTSLFYTEQENFATYTAQLTSQFEALNIAVPETRDAYRALVDGIVVVDEASRDQFNSLVALAPAMDTYYKQLQQQADGINEVNQALADGLDKNLFTTYAEYQTYKGLTANYGESFAQDYAANFKAGLITRDATGRAYAANDPSANLVTELKRLQAAQEAQVVQMAEVASILRKFDRLGMPLERAA